MCSCGCNTCETKIRGPLLTEGKVKSLLSEGLQYHIDKKIPLFETVYRIGSEKHLSLIKEARKMYSRNVIDLCEEDEALIKTHLGEFGLFYEIEIGDKVKASKEYGGLSGKVVDIRGSFVVVKTKEGNESYHESDLQVLNKEGAAVPLDLPMLSEGMFDAVNLQQKLNDLGYSVKVNYDKDFDGYEIYLKKPVDSDKIFFDAKKLGFPNVRVYDDVNEAKKKKKDPPLGKPKRGGSKAYYVYVRDPKTKRIKKVSFGSGGLRAKIKNKKARNAFAKRHRCSEKKDRTKASYWSCNLPRYASVLGLGANMNTFW